MVLIEGLKPTLVGIALGAAGALLAARLLEKLVFGVKASDPLTLGVVAGALLVCRSPRACYRPGALAAEIR
jgi:putative ABC transport system permease protein